MLIQPHALQMNLETTTRPGDGRILCIKPSKYLFMTIITASSTLQSLQVASVSLPLLENRQYAFSGARPLGPSG